MKVAPTLPSPQTSRRLQRNPRRRRLGGVCAGIADYTGLDVGLVRLLFVLSIFVSASLSVWLYLALWFLLPAATEAEMPDVSWALRRELRRIEKRLAKLHKRNEPAVADLAQEAFEALKVLAPGFDRAGLGPRELELRQAALIRFPQLLDALLGLPAAALSRWDRGGPSPAALLVEQLAELRSQLQAASLARVEQWFRDLGGAGDSSRSADYEAFRRQLDPLADRLGDSAGAATQASLAAIQDKLGFLLERLGESEEILDLRPFEVRKIAFEYLPDALGQYLQLPAAMARHQPLANGKTAEESLNEQLQLLDTTLQDLAKSLFEKDAGGLLVHGRFLREKFAEQPFRLEGR